MSRSQSAIRGTPPIGMSKSSASNPATEGCGMASHSSSAKERPRWRSFRSQNPRPLREAKVALGFCISLSGPTEKDSRRPNANSTIAGSPSVSKTTKFPTRSTSLIRTGTLSRSRLTTSDQRALASRASNSALRESRRILARRTRRWLRRRQRRPSTNRRHRAHSRAPQRGTRSRCGKTVRRAPEAIVAPE